MANLPIFDIAGSALQAQSTRLNTLASNLANAGNVSGDPNAVYKPIEPMFRATPVAGGDAALKGVAVTSIEQSQAAPLKLSQDTHVYACQNGQTVQVAYVRADTAGQGGPSFAVLKYRGQSYGLAEAVSGSGARYVGHAGLNTASGLEWWEHQGEATLSTFRGNDARTTSTLLTCKVAR